MTTNTLYGIPNCDQVKKARTWLADNAISHDFHDFKKSGLNPAIIQNWLTDVSWETLINRKGTTWRKLDDARKAAIIDTNSAIALMLEQPSIIKRPVLSTNAATSVGYSEELYQQIFKK